MKLPAVAIAAAFACGILLGGWHILQPGVSSDAFLAAGFLYLGAAILAGLALALRGFVRTAGAASLLCWAGLGLLASGIAQQPLPADHVLIRIAVHEVNPKTPLRWYGQLRTDPERLPWGYALDVALTGVESADGFLPIRGGMRVGFTPKEEDPALPDVHAGDEIAVFTQARLPQVYRDAGAFDRRAFLADQGIHLQATLRSSKLLAKIGTPPPSLRTRLARVRTRLRETLDAQFPGSPKVAGILRAMLLGDRSFVEREESLDFQKTGTFHVLVVAGLHIGALAVFLIWLSRKLRFPPSISTALFLVCLASYVAVVEQRAPVLRAGLMAAIVVIGGFFYRRLELLNSAALAALLLLIANPTLLRDTSFQLSFLAIGCIAGIGVPWIDERLQPYVRALRHWRDVSRDRSYTPRMTQLRLDIRDGMRLCGSIFPANLTTRAQDVTARVVGAGFRIAELFVLSVILQVGMSPLMAGSFHRISLLGPLANLVAVPLVGIIVPLGLFSLATGLIVPPLGRALGYPLAWLVSLQSSAVS